MALAAGAFVLLAVVAACGGAAGSEAGGASDAASPTPRPGGTYNYPLQYDVGSLLPFRVMDSPSPEVAHQMYEGLVAYETQADGRVVTVPCLAQSWSANADATVWTIHLRRGVRFQAPVDREVTAADVVADCRFAADPRNEVATAYMYGVIRGTDEFGQVTPADVDAFGVQALDRYRVRFTLKQPFASFPDTLGNSAFWVWPLDYLRRVGRAGFEERPVGTGPFGLSRRVPGDYVDLVRNPGWWNAPSGQPYLESVHFQVFKSVTSELQAFQKGLVDYTWVPQGQVAASRSLPQVQSGEWEARVLPVEGLQYLAFNMTDPVVGGDVGLPLRQALDCAIDRRALVADVGDGVHIPQTGLVPPIFPGWEDEQPPQDYDPGRARELFAQAGSPALSLVFWDDRLIQAEAEWLRDSFSAAGIPVQLRRVSWRRYEAFYSAGRLPAIYITGWLSDYPSYDNFLYDAYVSSASRYSLGTSYSNRDVDRLLTLARSTTDARKHLDLSRRAAHEVAADKPVIPLFEFAEYRLLSTRIAGFSVSPLYGVDAWKLWVR